MTEEEIEKINIEIDDIIIKRAKYIQEYYLKIRNILKEGYEGDTELNPLRVEICHCIFFGLFQAAITLTNHLLEKLLKTALVYKNANYNSSHELTTEAIAAAFDEARQKYSTNSLTININAACSQGLITKDEKVKLIKIREELRNPYSHADPNPIHKNKKIPIQGVSLTDIGFKVDPQNIVEILRLPFIQGISQVYHAEAHAFPYFEYVDGLIRRVLLKVFPKGLDKEQPQCEP